MGGRFHPRLNINTRPIANKYHEGKVKRTLKRGLKVHETVQGEANAADVFAWVWLGLVLGWSYVIQGNRFTELAA